MEIRYYFIFAAVIIFLQLLIYLFSRTLNWVLGEKRLPAAQRRLRIALFAVPNMLVAGHLLQFYAAFRLIALILVLLLFSAFVSLTFGVIRRIMPQIDRTLRRLYPIAFLALLGLALYNAYTPVVRHYRITLNKPLAQPLRIGMASDLHLGKWFGSRSLDKLADIMQAENVDLILLPGDLMDDNTDAYLSENMPPHLAKLKAPLGVYATLGNHDFFGHQLEIVRQLQAAGITVLQDQTLTLDNGITLVGRNDDLYQARPSAATLLQNLNTALPVILLDHRPTDVETHAALPIDIQVSGHTHKGQILPANLITALLYRLDYGYENINNTHFFVSSGYGFWGIPLRLGSQSEVMIIDVEGK